MKADVLRKKYIQFFEKRGHKQIPAVSLVPKDDPTTLFTSSGMQPLVPYLMGQKHPLGKRLVDSQICFRAEDIEEIGDNRHTTFFEMLGNWSLGNYFKKQQLPWFFEFLTDVVELDPSRLYVTVFQGNKEIDVKRDQQSVEIWKKLFQKKGIKAETASQADKKGLQGARIFYYSEKFGNWWSRSGPPDKMPVNEPGGPCSEVFYDFGEDLGIHENSPYRNASCHPNCDCGRFLEIGNSVFMEYKKTKTGFEKLKQRNVDFGGGLERILAAKLNTPDIFKTNLFAPIIEEIEKASSQRYSQAREEFRIIADHLKAAVFMAYDGVNPGNKKQDYIMRRLIRRAVLKMKKINVKTDQAIPKICNKIIDIYKKPYLNRQDFNPVPGIKQETEKFQCLLENGIKKISQTSIDKIDAQFAFDLYQTEGLPFEVIEQLLEGKKELDKDKFQQLLKKHKKLSRQTSKGMFKSGLADHSQEVKKLHTATHLLHSALRKVLGEKVKQVGSNITKDRLRFDFTYNRALEKEQLRKIEKLVNQAIEQDLFVSCRTMKLKEAQKTGALAFFGQKYPDKVKVYTVGDRKEPFSCELCSGPHVERTGVLGRFKIYKEKSSGAGRRRIYGKLE